MKSLFLIFRSKIYTALILLVVIFVIGVFGFKSIDGFSWIDAIYMTVITISTVGFSEVHPLNDNAKLFAAGLILSSVIILGYAIKVITEYVLSKSNIEEYNKKKMQKKIKVMSQHIIICGYGRNGKQAAKKLLAYNKPFVIIEKDKTVIDKYQDENLSFVYGNANEDEVLHEAGISKAMTLITALPDDAENLFVVLSARQINNDLNIISRASQETSYQKLKFAGANNVIMPDRIGGDHMASLVVVPDLIEFIDNLSIVGNSNINIEEVPVNKLYDTSLVRTISDLDLRKKTGCSVIGFKTPNGDYEVNPEANTELVDGSKIIVLGRPDQIQKLNSTYNL